MSCKAALRNPFCTKALVETQTMWVKYKVKPGFELVTQVACNMPCKKTICSIPFSLSLKSCLVF